MPLNQCAPVSPKWNGFDPFSLGGLHSPLQVGSSTQNAAWYDASDLSSMIYDGSNRVSLWADKSGNSATNCLVLNGASENYASAPDSAALSPAGDLFLGLVGSLPNWSSGADVYACSKFLNAGQRSYRLYLGTTGAITFIGSTDGTNNTINTGSTSVVPFANFETGGIGMFRNATTGDVTFYTSSDLGITWQQLGSVRTGLTTGALFDGTDELRIGGHVSNNWAGTIRRTIVGTQSAGTGTLVFDADFTAQSKLATSFTESSSNAATVTINTSGSTGARICGARDLYQGTVANQPILTIAGGGRNYLTFDGTNDFLKAGVFSLAQPETVYFAGSQVTWTGGVGDTFFDGNAAGNRMAVYQSTSTPTLRLEGGATPATNFSDMPLATRGVLTAGFNGAASLLRWNRLAATVINGGTNAANGFMVGAWYQPSGFANITASEIVIRNVADSTTTQDRLILYLGRKWGVSV